MLPKTHYFQAESVAYVYATEYFLIHLSNDKEKDWDKLLSHVGTYAVNMGGTCFTEKVYNRHWKAISSVIKRNAEEIFKRHIEISQCKRFFK